tara:strand:+ start:62 stop:478 length:417 start_codon:yes stop_codon:yes gene_type:complete
MAFSEEIQALVKYRKVDRYVRDCIAIYAYVDKSNWVQFFLAYEDDIDGKESEYEAMQDEEGYIESNAIELMKDEAIIGGHFALAHSPTEDPVFYIDFDMSARTPCREYLSDWVSRFGMIHDFVNEFKWLRRGLYHVKK